MIGVGDVMTKERKERERKKIIREQTTTKIGRQGGKRSKE
jgi:hypothetical protein